VLSFSDDELQTLMTAAAVPIPPPHRGQFLRTLAIELMQRPAE
jgi:hypothetical protein